MMLEKNQNVTQLLIDYRNGDSLAEASLLPLVYDELKRLAQTHMNKESTSHTWQATELVHEAMLKLLGKNHQYHDRQHFCAVASMVLRRVLVDHARAKQSAKRGVDFFQVTLSVNQPDLTLAADDILSLDRALEKLAATDSRKVKIIELVYFAGMDHAEICQQLDISRTTLHRELVFTKAWLKRELGDNND
jgi:RNA polymerase sigma factor (TIGR02999 family)